MSNNLSNSLICSNSSSISSTNDDNGNHNTSNTDFHCDNENKYNNDKYYNNSFCVNNKWNDKGKKLSPSGNESLLVQNSAHDSWSSRHNRLFHVINKSHDCLIQLE